jgi:hypothetical protein
VGVLEEHLRVDDFEENGGGGDHTTS